jgi:hypothetical protein
MEQAGPPARCASHARPFIGRRTLTMTSLTRISLANRLIVGLVTLAIIAFGVLSIFALKQELLPSITAPTAFVSASYPGSSPQIVAKEVSTPIEQAALGVSGVTKVTSTSTNGRAWRSPPMPRSAGPGSWWTTSPCPPSPRSTESGRSP